MADIRMANDRGVANIHAQVDVVSDNPPLIDGSLVQGAKGRPLCWELRILRVPIHGAPRDRFWGPLPVPMCERDLPLIATAHVLDVFLGR